MSLFVRQAGGWGTRAASEPPRVGQKQPAYPRPSTCCAAIWPSERGKAAQAAPLASSFPTRQLPGA